MTDDDVLAEWIGTRADVPVPAGFATRVLDALPPGPPGARPEPARRTRLSPTGLLLRAAAVLLVAAGCLWRAFFLLDLFLV